MRIFISMTDQTGSNKTSRISILNCTDTNELIKQISKELNINKNAYIFCLKNQIVNLRILENWPLNIYNIKNGSWIVLKENQLFYKKQPSLSSTTSLQKIQENSEDFYHEESSINSLNENNQLNSSQGRTSFFSKKSEKDYSEYYDQQLTKMLQYTRNNMLFKIANLLKQQPQIQDQAQRQKIMQIKNKYILNQLGQCGRNCLHWAIHNQNLQIMTFLLLKYSDHTILTIDQYSPLQLAVIHRNVQITKILVTQPKVDINLLTVHGTALHLAAYHCSTQLVKVLLQNGANPQQRNKQNKKPIQLTELKQIISIFQNYELKNKLRLLKPNINKGNVLKIRGLTFRGKQRTLMCNPFKDDLIFYKDNQIVDHKIKIKNIKKLQKIQQKSWLMDDKIKYLKIIYQVQGQQDKIIIGIKNLNIFNRWIVVLELAKTYVDNLEFVSKIQPQNQLIQILDDIKNQIKIHKRQIKINKKIQSPQKTRYSIMNMKIATQQQQQQMINKQSGQLSFLSNLKSYNDCQTKSQVSNDQRKSFQQSQILIGSIIMDKNFDSPPLRNSMNFKQNSVNLVSINNQNNLSNVQKRINSAPNFRKQSDDISKISQFNLIQQRKIQKFNQKIIDKPQKPKISFSDFQFKKLLGSGAFGQVYLTKNKKNDKLYAMKVLNKKKLMAKKQLKYAISQTNILKRIHHPFIVDLYHSFQTPSNLYLTLDYCPYGDLSEALSQKQRFSQTTTKFIIVQMILAIQYLHYQKIIYRDLKPENILISQDGYIKLIDFGLSKQNNFSTSFCGSPAYLSPQMLQKKGHSFPTDIYGIGCVLYQMVIGQPPFFDQSIEQLFQNIKSARLKFPGYLSKQIKSLISRMLQRDPHKRIGSKNINQLKQHQFFKGINWQKILNKQMSAPKQIYPQQIQDDYFKLQNQLQGDKLKYVDQQYTQNTMFNRVKGFSFSRQQ